jgi:hypothetical protein
LLLYTFNGRKGFDNDHVNTIGVHLGLLRLGLRLLTLMFAMVGTVATVAVVLRCNKTTGEEAYNGHNNKFLHYIIF